MSSDKRQFDDFTKFGGKINSDGVYVYPTLYYYDTHQNKRFWNVFVRLIKIKQGKHPNHKYGWDISKDTVVKIEKEYLADSDLPNDVVAQVWTENGVIKSEKIARSTPSYPIPANVGKANERNVLKQGLVKARAAYLKQHEKGGRTQSELNECIKKMKESSQKNVEEDTRYFPMLARNFQDEKDKLTYPVIVQPKLDGMRCMAFLNTNKNPTDQNVILYSRNMKDITGFDHLRKELLEPLLDLYNNEENVSLYIDGEFYQHGARLQDIVGEVRNIQKNNKPKHDGLKLYLFDCFYPSKTKMNYVDRLDLLTSFFKHQFKWTVLVPYQMAENESEVHKLYKKTISDKYEGVMIKEPKSPYLTSSTKSGSNLRSRSVLKLKGHFDEEYLIVDFTEGTRGKDKGALIWVLETSNKHKFNATPKNMSYNERYNLYKELTENPTKFNKMYKNKMMTVEYQDKSKDGVPLRAKANAIPRDYE